MSGTILEVASRGDLNALHQLISAGTNPASASQDGSTALHVSARYGHQAIVQYLLQAKVKANVQNSTGNTPLHMALGYGHQGCVSLLVQNGADPTLKNKEGKAPIDYCKTVELKQWVMQHAQPQMPQVQPQMPAAQAFPQPGAANYATMSSVPVGATAMPAPQASPASASNYVSMSAYQNSPQMNSMNSIGGSSGSGGSPGFGSSTPLTLETAAAHIARVEEEKKTLTLKVREKIAQIVEERNKALEEARNLRTQVSMGASSGNLNVDQLRNQLVQQQQQIMQQQDARLMLERKVKEKIQQVMEDKNNALERVAQLEQLMGSNMNQGNLQERLQYMSEENEKYMAKITDLEGKLYQARNSSGQVEQYYRQQQQTQAQELYNVQQHNHQLQTYSAQAAAAKQQVDHELNQAVERSQRLENAVSELYHKLKDRETRIAELETLSNLGNVAATGNVNSELVKKNAELKGQTEMLKEEIAAHEKESDARQKEFNRLNRETTSIISDKTALENKVKNLTGDLDAALSKLKALEESNLALRKQEGPEEQLEVEEDPDEKEGNLVLIRNEGQAPTIKGGTVDILVTRLCQSSSRDPDYLPAFLLTYRTFLTPEELFTKISDIFRALHVPDDITDETEKAAYFETHVKAVRLRVFSILKSWIEKFFWDFNKNDDLKDRLSKFVEGDLAESDKYMQKLGQTLTRLIAKKDKQGNELDHLNLKAHTEPPKAIIPKSVVMGGPATFMELNPLEIARHLTLIESSFFRSVHLTEFMGQAWSKKDKEKRAPNVCAFIKRFNLVSNWVTTEVVSQIDNLKQRTAVVEKFIKIAAHFRELNNFNGVMEIVAGLQSSSVHRLKKTWAGVKGKSMAKYDELRELMNNRGSYKAFRAAVHHAEPPLVPYLGVFLTDLTFIEDGNPDTIINENLVNFSKRGSAVFVSASSQENLGWRQGQVYGQVRRAS
eukprot:TRINITY_DN3936_c0_g1_i1.p1 TRINITY_DN3936_c0_g1~~TRINITY_DN3936_c0_g1_i1.p1  ORF type:complete len:950 (-),score=365.17 TRINITY_DN3936_c0_g1_i1:375-3224(-)